MSCCWTSQPMTSTWIRCVRWKKRCSTSRAARLSSATIAGFSIGSRRTFWPSKAKGRSHGSRATIKHTSKIASGAWCPRTASHGDTVLEVLEIDGGPRSSPESPEITRRAPVLENSMDPQGSEQATRAPAHSSGFEPGETADFGSACSNCSAVGCKVLVERSKGLLWGRVCQNPVPY